jgi:predicted RNA methylase
MTETEKQVFDGCTIEGNNVYLPNQLDRPTYNKINKALIGIGGKWDRKEKAHVFPKDPTELLGRVQDGEKINLKKDYQFFETPPELATRLVFLATDGRELGTVLEPSAGQGAIVHAIVRSGRHSNIDCIELMDTNSEILSRMPYVTLMRDYLDDNIVTDFLKYKGDAYDTIIANPPFSKNQDINHVYKMFEVLKTGGRMVSIISNHYQESVNFKESSFREWLEEKNAQIYNIPMGTFKSSGTMVGGKIVVINK